MKTCPTCQQTYNDSEMFCQNDGMSLVGFGSTQETVIIQTPDVNRKTFLPQFGHNRAIQSTNPLMYLMFGAILLLSIVVVGLGVAFFYEKSKEEKTETTKKEDKTGNTTSQIPQTSDPVEDEKTKELEDKLTQLERKLQENKKLEAKQPAGIITQTNRLEIINPNKFRKILVNQRVPNCQESLENCGNKTLDLLGIKKNGKVETFIYPTKVGIYLLSREISDDDSVIGERVRIAFLIKEDGYEFVQIGVQNKCNRGATINKWTKDSCI